VIGRTFDIELLEQIAEADEEELLDTLDRALEASVLVESVERAGRFRFTHALINHALYGALSATRRGRLHRRVAEALERLCSEEAGERLVTESLAETAGSAGGSAAILAYHWREAGDSERAVDYLLKAAEQAELGRAQAETVALFNQAVELIPEGDAKRLRELNLKRAVAYARYSHVIWGDAADVAKARRAQRSGEGGPSHEH
jgi:predicted ATPase